MNVFFSSPFAFIALSAIPLLAAIYLLRNRFRVCKVSSLMLWQDQRKARQGGLNVSRIQTPLLFFLELLAITTLILAAAGPMIRSNNKTRTFVIILDDSFSMLAGDETSSRDKAVKEIETLLDQSGDFNARFVAAGITPKLLGNAVSTVSQAIDTLENWKCLSPVADLHKSLTLAGELAGKTARILVVTDHKPGVVPQGGRIEYWAFGKSLSNTAFVNAGRTSFEDRDRCFLAVANLSDNFIKTELIVEAPADQQRILHESIELEPRQIYRTVFEPQTAASLLRARIASDCLDIDNEILLAKETPKILNIQLDIQNQDLRSAVDKAVRAVKFVLLASGEPHLLITDSALPPPAESQIWTTQISTEPNAASYLGPFIMDRSHPLTEGLSLEGVIWGAAETNKFTGLPVIAAGNIPLLTDRESLADLHNITINLNHDLSTLLQSPNWPILIFNLIQWRRTFLPGLSQSNLVLGSAVTFTRDLREKDLFLIGPDNNARDISTLVRTVFIDPDVPGLYRIKTQSRQYALAVNAMSKSESDITDADTGKWGQWQQGEVFWWEYSNVDWILLVFALALLTAHRFATAQYQGSGL